MTAPDALAQRHGQALLGMLGVDAADIVAPADHPALAWRRAGLMNVTGQADGPGLVAPLALTSAADGALAALRFLAHDADLPLSGAALLGERARLLRLERRGATSPNGSCRLIACMDGSLALNLPRADDWDLVPALLGASARTWADVARLAAGRPCEELLARGRLLGLAIAPVRDARQVVPFTITPGAGRGARTAVPLVVDLSALWAGPLAGSLLAIAGARVVKVESSRRPDGARRGDPTHHHLLNGAKESVALDFRAPEDVRRLRRLVAAADIVLESSRPRALAELGIVAEEVAARGGTWVSITAHGRAGAAADWIGFGDDVAVAGGVASAMARGWGEALFAGDAVADPLTGITAALAAWACWRQNRGALVSVPMADVVSDACRLHEASAEETRGWQALALADDAALYPQRQASAPARPMGADTTTVFRALPPGA